LRQKVPQFWNLKTPSHALKLCHNFLECEVKHVPDHDELHVHYVMRPPSVQQLDSLINLDPNSTLKINLDDQQIQSQIKNWEPIEWSVIEKLGPEYIPAEYKAFQIGNFSVIEIPLEPTQGRKTTLG